MDFVERSYWENQTSKFKFEVARENDLIRQLISQWAMPVKNKSALEIGCVPGRYLGYLGTLGYELNGIDVLPEAISGMKEWFEKNHFQIGDIKNLELESMSTERKFDLVCSFGLIEHYANYEDILRKHMELVAPKGLLIVTTPNYAGWLQNKLHHFLDLENLKRHNLEAMQPHRWSALASECGFEILYQGYFGYFSFWVEESDSRSLMKKWMVNGIIKSLPITSRLFPDNTRSISPFCGIVARRK